jgi:histidyl-tRNA synthetase
MDKLLAEAPHIIDHLCEDCADHFAELRRLLNAIGVPFTINFRLVRGIDYYVKTVFEVWAEGIGAQAAMFGGGRYDGLSEAIGGPPTPGVGFGSGIERVIAGLQAQDLAPPPRRPAMVMIAHFGGDTKVEAVKLAQELRERDVSTFLAFGRSRRSMKSQMREADKREVEYTLILGEQELDDKMVTVRSMAEGEQTTVERAKLVAWLYTHHNNGSN